MRRPQGNWILIARFAWRFKGVFRKAWVANAFGCVGAGLQLAIPLATVKIINKAIPARDYHSLMHLVATIGIAALLAITASGLESYYSVLFRERANIILEMLLFRHLQRQPPEFFKSHDSSYIMSRASNDNATALELISSFTTVGRTLAMLFAGLLVLPFFNWKLGLFVISILPLYAWLLVSFNARTRKAFLVVSEETAQASRELFESLAGVYETKAYGVEKYRAYRYLARLASRTRAFVKARFLMAAGEQLTQAVSFFLSFVVIAYGGACVIAGRLSLGELIGFTTVSAYLLFPVNTAVHHILRGQKSVVAVQRVEEWLNMPVELDLPMSSSGKETFQALGHLRFEHVTFAYPGQSVLLQNISFEVMPGQAVLIMGASGIGKTTLISMLPRFVTPASGAIYLDSIPLKLIPLKELRRQIAYVSQDVFLFSDTIANNIRIGNRAASDQDVYEAARMANALGFIESLPEGFKTQVGERGARLSGGQRQRIAIARAVIRNAPILILDEATSAVDIETESLVHDSLAGLMKDRTTIIIAHHATAFLENVDKVLVLQNGCLRSSNTDPAEYLGASVQR
jgi:ABC-type multidrug transport system fused ATPase/permease subunit